MNPKKFALAEHFSFSFSSKKRVVSVLCLVLSVSFLGFSLIFTNPLSQKQSWFNASSLHSSLVSWFFPRPALDISSSSDSELQKSSDFLEGNKTESVSVKPHVENVAVTHEDASSSGSSDFEKMVGDYNGNCDIFNGKWVRDQRKPYYHGGSCPYIDLPFDCYANGRPDDDFEKWRWQPNRCEIPSFNGTDFLERLRGKRLVFVGDSLNRNMWQSMVCLLRHDVMNKSRVQVVSGKNEFKAEGLDSFRYEDYNCFVDFVRTPFLVREMSFNSGKGPEMETLRLDLMDETTSKYKEADILVFNTGHWWTHEKPSRGKDYYQEGDHVYPMLNVKEAYMKAITTWAKWVDDNIDSNKTRVIFRGYSVTHFKGVQWNSDGQCYKETEPIHNESYLKQYPSKMKTLESVIKQMKTPVMYLNISKLTDYRKDAHPAIYKMGYQTAEELIAAEKSPDCSHWCLPGVPDAWNELLYASLLMEGWGSSV